MRPPPHPVQRVVAPKGAPPKAPEATFARVRPIQYSIQWNATLRGPMRSSTEGPSGDVRMCLFLLVQRFVAPMGAPPQTPAATFACVRTTPYSAV
eukprot:7718336-Pyramimonas_sp.AAC.1